MTSVTAPPRRTQAQRRAHSRYALLEAAARGLSRRGYADLVLEEVATDAGYTRGALYHQFRSKEDLALAVVMWVEETWWAHMADVITTDDPVEALRAVARAHAVFCRRDIARVMMTLRVEFSGREHPVGQAVATATERVVSECTKLVRQARAAGQVAAAGPPPRVLAQALLGAVEGLVIEIAGRAPYDADLAERVVVGLLDAPAPAQPKSRRR